MFPVKSMLDYSNEMNGLFPKTQKIDAVPNIFNQFLLQSPVANRSSSSADSISPENFFDSQFSINQSEPISLRPNVASYEKTHNQESLYFNLNTPSRDLQNQSLHNPNLYDYFTPKSTPNYESYKTFQDSTISATPVPIRQKYPVGRKILGGTSQVKAKPKIDSDVDFGIWQIEDANTPPNSYNKNYELFPTSDNLEVPSSKLYSNLITVSPNNSISSQLSYMSSAGNVPSRPDSSLSLHNSQSAHNLHYNKFQISRSSQNIASPKICTFCRKNGEMPMVYSNHSVKEKMDGKYIVTCPILRSHVCKICHASGDNAHTLTYCPILRNTNDGKPLTSTTVTLKNTRLKSNGRRRY